MRSLNRPMFRTGGPIKEGVMHGIREPYKHGQRVMPTSDGSRPGYAGPLVLAAPAAVTAARAGIMRAAPKVFRYVKNLFGKTGPVTKTVPKQGPTYFPPTGRSLSSKGYPGGQITGTPRGPGSAQVTSQEFQANPFGKYVLGSPEAGLAKKIYEGRGFLGKPIKAIAKSPTAGLGIVYMGGKWLWPDGKEATETEVIEQFKKGSGVPGGGDKGMRGDGSYDSARATELAKAAKEKRINSLLETMGYDKAQKNAAYDALIDASKIITDRGNLKGDVTGEVINPIIQATSKRLDKPEQIREAVGLMQTKADIQKEMNKEENALANELKRTQIAAGKKTLAGGSLEEAVLAQTLKQGAPTGATLATIARAKGVDAKVLPIKIPKNTDTVDHAITVITESWTNPEVPRVEPGYYVVKDRIIIIDEEGNVSPLY